MKKCHSLYLRIAGLVFQIKIPKAGILTRLWVNNLNTYYKAFLTKKSARPTAIINIQAKSNWQIKQTKKIGFLRKEKSSLGIFNWKTKKGSFDIFSSFYFFDCFLRMAFTKIIGEHQGLVLHASSTAINKQIFVFSAPKQTGKSTIISLCPYPHQTYADDNTIIRQVNKKILVYPCPFLERKKLVLKRRLLPLELKKIFFLRQANKNEITAIKNNKKKLLFFWRNSKSITLNFSLIKKVNFYLLEFKQEKNIWEEIIKVK